MADEIIVNDGGAPARILPFIANETIAAGDYVGLTTNGQVIATLVSGNHGLGVSLTAATSGNIVNLVTGKGVVLKTYCSGTINPGARCFLGTDLMYLQNAGTTAASGQAVATYVESSALAGGDGLALKKVIFG
jgi:predicted RecA/RadA family phage recombinase